MKRKQVDLIECPCQDGITTVQGEPVLRHVKILGFDSKNRRRYTQEAAAEAIGLYASAKVNIDHPEGNPHATRGLRDRFGKLENITSEQDGLFGDLRYNPSHPLAETVRWWAENDPSAIGLSHNAVGQGRDEDGVFVVEKIVSVRSVDLVADPATTKGLFESQQPMTIKLKRLFETAKWEKKHEAAIQRRIKKLFEDDYLDADMDVDGEDGMDHHAALKAGFDQSCYAVIDDPDMTADEKVARIRKLLKAHEKLASDKPGEEKSDEEEGEGEENEDDPHFEPEDDKPDKDAKKAMDEAVREKARKDPAFRSVLERLDGYEAKERLQAKREKAIRLCKEARLPDAAVTDVFVESLLSADSDKDMKRLIEDRRQILGTKKPVSAGSGSAGISDEEFKRRLGVPARKKVS